MFTPWFRNGLEVTSQMQTSGTAVFLRILPKKFPRKAIGVRVGCQATPVEATPNEVKEVAPAGDDDDDLDLCGDETEKEGPYYMRTGSCKYGAHV